jgi:hypothetical protein
MHNYRKIWFCSKEAAWICRNMSLWYIVAKKKPLVDIEVVNVVNLRPFQRNVYICCFMVFNATFNNISGISWRSVLLEEEIGVPGENHRAVASHWQTLSHNVLYKVNVLHVDQKSYICQSTQDIVNIKM